jgi:hypothetical protein
MEQQRTQKILDKKAIIKILKNYCDSKKTAYNMGFAASVAGRKNNRQFYKAKLQFGLDKQL